MNSNPATTNPASSGSTITVLPTADGTPTVRWDMTAEASDAVLALLYNAAKQDPNGESEKLLESLRQAVIEATGFNASEVAGCPGLWPNAEPFALNEPAVLGGDLEGSVSVLLPGHVGVLEAVPVAVTEANAHGANLDSSDTRLTADVHPPQWMVLHTCEAHDHDFHPELAPHGPQTPGAIQVTRVDLFHL